MSGGGSRPQKGGMSSKSASSCDFTEENVVNFEKERDESEQTLKELSLYKTELSQDNGLKKAKLNTFDIELSKLHLDQVHVVQRIGEKETFIQQNR